MKKFFTVLYIFILAGFTQSCLDDSDEIRVSYVTKGIDSISMPDSAMLGNRVLIKPYITIKENCQNFYTMDYQSIENERIIGMWLAEFEEEACGQDITIEPSFYFFPQDSGTYRFKFWAGEEQGNNIFLTKDIYIYQD